MKRKDTPPLPSLESLQQQIDAAQGRAEPGKADSSTTPGDAGLALRLGVELLAGVAVGAGLGLALDKWLHTAPWLFIACFFLGCAAGFLNLKRTAEQLDTAAESATTPRADNASNPSQNKGKN